MKQIWLEKEIQMLKVALLIVIASHGLIQLNLIKAFLLYL
jgi:hypothetical protein